MREYQSKDACHKVPYPDERTARQALKTLRYRGIKEAYQCPTCKGEVWHLTRMRRGKIKRPPKEP